MDDYARTLYMIALRKIQDSESSPFVCYELTRTLDGEEGRPSFRAVNRDVFHHFASLFDGRRWTKRGDRLMCGSDSAWWEDCWKEPRVRALECLLRD